MNDPECTVCKDFMKSCISNPENCPSSKAYKVRKNNWTWRDNIRLFCKGLFTRRKS